MASMHNASPRMNQVEVGFAKRLGDKRSWGYKGNVIVEYYDEVNDEWHTVEMCADGARALARELTFVAKMIDPQKRKAST